MIGALRQAMHGNVLDRRIYEQHLFKPRGGGIVAERGVDIESQPGWLGLSGQKSSAWIQENGQGTRRSSPREFGRYFTHKSRLKELVRIVGRRDACPGLSANLGGRVVQQPVGTMLGQCRTRS